MSFNVVKKLGIGNHEQIDYKIKIYFRVIKRQLHCPHASKQVFLREFKESISWYIEEHPSASISEIIQEFGEPNDIARHFIEESDLYILKKALNIRKTVLAIGIAVALITTVVITAAVIVNYVAECSFREGYFMETISQIEMEAESQSVSWEYF